MVATLRGTRAPLSPVELDGDLFDELCKAKGAKTETARASLVKIDRRTLLRWREGTVTPGLDTALVVATELDSDVTELWRLRRSHR
jgi:hypothetical protein